MTKPKIIRYLENGEYRYATVKYLGDLERLKTTAKSDIVSAINELFENGGATNLPPDIEQRLSELEANKVAQDSKNEVQDSKIAEHEGKITDQGTKQAQQDEVIQAVKTEYELSKQDIILLQESQEQSRADITSALNKADEVKTQTDQIIIDLSNKVEQADYQVQYDQVKTDLLNKVDSSKHKADYDTLILELGDKVDSIEYQTKVDALNASIASHKEELESHGGKITTIQSDLDTVEGQFTLQAQTLSTLDQKVSSHETAITTNATAIGLKASQTSVDAIDGRVETAEGKIEVQAGQISQRVTKTEFDGAVGVNKWIASKYVLTGTDLSTTPPSFPLLREKQASEVKDIVDSITPAVFTGTGVVTHLFTNIYLQTAKTISLSVKYNSSLGIYVNGAKIYENKSNAQAVVPVSISLRAGWNTIEILHGLKSGTPVLSLGSTISTLVDKMTTVIGVGDKNETRLTQAESAIVQTEKAIVLKANAEEVTAIGNRVEATEGSITILNDAIASKVEQTSFDAYSQRVSEAESTIIQLSNSISQKVSQTDYDILNERVVTAESTITQHTTQISQKVSTTDFDGLKGRVSSAETAITQANDAIALKASQDSLDTVSGRLTTAEGQLTVATDEIATKVSQTDFDTLETNVGNIEGRVSASETAITQTTDSINLKANKTDVYTKSETDTELGKKANQTDVTAITNSVNDMSSDLKVTPLEKQILKTDWDRIKAEYTQVLANAKVSTVAVSTTAFTNAYNALNSTTPKIEAEVLLTMGTTYTFGSTTLRDAFRTKFNTYFSELEKIRKAINDKVNSTANTANTTANTLKDTTIPALTTRISTAESEIDQTTEAIALRVTKTEMDTEISGAKTHATTAVNDAKAEIKITTDGISQTVSNLSSTVTSQGETIASHTTSISQMNGKIDLKAEASVVETIQNTANTAKTNADTAISNASSALSTATTAKSTADSVKSTADTAKSTADTAKSTAETASNTANNLKDNVIPALTSRVSTAEGQISVQAGQITSKVGMTEVNNAIGNIKIGGNNLILASNTPYSGTSYLVNGYTLTEDWVAGEEYTFVIKGTVPAGQKFGVWMNGGSSNVGYATAEFSKGITYVTFKAVATTSGNERKLSLYNYPSNTTESTVEWVALYKGNKPMDWTASAEEINSTIYDLTSRMQSAEQAITEDSIIATVTSSQSFADVFDVKADAQSIADNYVSNGKLSSELVKLDEETLKKIRNEIGNIDIETFSKFSELKQTTSNISANFTSAGGVNLLKNSVGFAGFDFWAKSGTIDIRQNEGLEVLGYGSGFYAEKGKSGTATQLVPVTPNKSYTLTIVLDKSVDNATNGQAGAEIYDGDTKLGFIGRDTNGGVTVGYETFTYTFTPKSTTAKIVLTVGSNAVATITGAMMNVGSQPLQWTMAHGEIYNTNVRFDMKGIKVSKIEDDKETKFTVMTPDKFAGYYDVNGDGVIDSNDNSPDEVFKMDEDSFVMKKAVMKEEISMGTVKVLNINTSSNKGWAFIADM